jgi:putative FmdB family regulatory protein
MPIYEYVCKKCDHSFEAIVQGSSKPECPSCGSRNLEKQLSVFAVTAGNSGAGARVPEACRSCAHPGGPGACAMRDRG